MNAEQARRLCDEMMDLTRCHPRHARLALLRAGQIGQAFAATPGWRVDAEFADCLAALEQWLQSDPCGPRSASSMTEALLRLRCAVELACESAQRRPDLPPADFSLLQPG